MATLLETVRRLEGDAPNALLTFALATKGVAEAAGVTEATARRRLIDAINHGLLVKLVEDTPPRHLVRLPDPAEGWTYAYLTPSPLRVTQPVEVAASDREAGAAANGQRRQFVATPERLEEVRRWVSDHRFGSIRAANDAQRPRMRKNRWVPGAGVIQA
ncbi:hypothetical protein OG401_14480 [Kitasatospora purpeofusca]|uniref:hypothetical protein n=1 Tax=Kitasatospora purpeofusca TaxID=67352 RepID=UPI002252299C|nr:hypothetical protein [Kitasatospora purpeofusca]MCX4685506.1 hypothetical protein [Kitasatospora purpeofusca]